jgi:hypothetical protein
MTEDAQRSPTDFVADDSLSLCVWVAPLWFVVLCVTAVGGAVIGVAVTGEGLGEFSPMAWGVGLLLSTVALVIGLWTLTGRVSVEVSQDRRSARITRVQWPVQAKSEFVSLEDVTQITVVGDDDLDSPDWMVVVLHGAQPPQRLELTAMTGVRRAQRIADALSNVLEPP